MRKVMSLAERNWRKQRQDERWERRVEYLMEVFSGPSCLISHPRLANWQARKEQSPSLLQPAGPPNLP